MEDYNTNGAFTTTEHAKLSPEEIDERKGNRAMLIGEKAQHAMEFEARVSRHLRSLGYRSYRVCAEVLREILFWEMSDAVIARDFWMYRVYKCDGGCDPDSRGHCCWDAGGFSRRNMDTSRDVLKEKLGLLEERRWYGGKVYYRINHRALFHFLAEMEGTHEPDDDVPDDREPEDTTAQSEQNEQTGVYETGKPDCTFRTVSKQRASSENSPEFPPFLPPVGWERGFERRGEEEHEVEHDKTYSSSLPPETGGRGVGSHETEQESATVPREPNATTYTQESATVPRDSEPDPLGERIARSVEARLESFHGYRLTEEEFATIAQDANSLQGRGADLGGLYEAADVLVDDFARSGKVGRI